MSARAFKIRRVANYRRVARRAARRYGLDPNIFERQIQQESGFQTDRTSPAGAQGIAQIMPATARGWGVDPNKPEAGAQRRGEEHGRLRQEVRRL